MMFRFAFVGAGSLNFAAGGTKKHCRSDRMTTNEVEKKLKQGLYNRKNKQGKSDIWKSFAIVCDKDGTELDFVSWDKCAKTLVYNGHNLAPLGWGDAHALFSPVKVSCFSRINNFSLHTLNKKLLRNVWKCEERRTVLGPQSVSNILFLHSNIMARWFIC